MLMPTAISLSCLFSLAQPFVCVYLFQHAYVHEGHQISFSVILCFVLPFWNWSQATTPQPSFWLHPVPCWGYKCSCGPNCLFISVLRSQTQVLIIVQQVLHQQTFKQDGQFGASSPAQPLWPGPCGVWCGVEWCAGPESVFFHLSFYQLLESQVITDPLKKGVTWRTVSPTWYHRSPSPASSDSGPWQKQSANISSHFLSLSQSTRHSLEDHDLLISVRSRCKGGDRGLIPLPPPRHRVFQIEGL